MAKKELQKSVGFKHYLTIAETTMSQDLLAEIPEHRKMIEIINKSLPEIKRATSVAGGKTQSQFMDNMMTVSHYTPLRNLRQILAQITSTRQALQENNTSLRKKEVELKMKMRDLENEKDDLRKEMLQIEIDEIKSNVENAKIYLSGAIRTLANYTEQYNNIVKKHNIGEWTEEDFEAEEEKYHIKKAFEQAYCAAIAHGDFIDEGNMIYFTQIGINGMSALNEMRAYLNFERSTFEKGQEPIHETFQQFLEAMANKYAGCSGKFADKKGMNIFSATASLKEGDKSLFDKKSGKHIEVMKKLYALSQSENKNEAESAASKLLKLLKKHGMKLGDLLKLL